MYYPYFRGKQYELITIRETAPLLAEARFVPIIEPVKAPMSGLKRALEEICKAGGAAIVIVNPTHGVHSKDGASISELLAQDFLKPEISAGILLKASMTAAEVVACFKDHKSHGVALIHAGFADAKGLATAMGSAIKETPHIFFPNCTDTYRKHFEDGKRIALRDGFERMKNREYPPVQRFSDLHIRYKDYNLTGFGDFLIVGDEYSESGGPAYAVAIHLTFINRDQDDEMFIYHFVSQTQDTPTDPAGKFGEALELLMAKLAEKNHYLFETSAIKEFRDLYRRGHFPGLGYIKKLSMKHHIETLKAYLT